MSVTLVCAEDCGVLEVVTWRGSWNYGWESGLWRQTARVLSRWPPPRWLTLGKSLSGLSPLVCKIV